MDRFESHIDDRRKFLHQYVQQIRDGSDAHEHRIYWGWCQDLYVVDDVGLRGRLLDRCGHTGDGGNVSRDGIDRC